MLVRLPRTCSEEQTETEGCEMLRLKEISEAPTHGIVAGVCAVTTFDLQNHTSLGQIRQSQLPSHRNVPDAKSEGEAD